MPSGTRIFRLMLLMLGILGAGCAKAGRVLPPPSISLPPPPTAPPRTLVQPSSPLLKIPESGDPWKPPVPPRDWKYIVLHHTGAKRGSVETINQAHLDNGWKGVGYHFVIGNGNGMPDGEIESTFRWQKQMHGAHAGGEGVDPVFNQAGIGIALIGDFNKAPPTAAQKVSLKRLVRTLSSTYRVPPDNVIGHRDVKATDCPGEHFSMPVLAR